MCKVTHTRLDVDYDKGVPITEPRKASPSWVAQAAAFAVMLAVFALAFAVKYWIYLPAA
jgi:hypothetical protein